MSLSPQASAAFYRWFLEELLKLLSAEEAGSLEADSQTLQGLRLYGQGGSGERGQSGSGERGQSFTTRQANLYPRPGTSYPTVLIDGERVALGNSRRQPRRLQRHAVGFAGVGGAPVPTPYQPVSSRAAAEQPLSHRVRGQLEPLPGFVAVPRKDDGVAPLEGPEAKYPFDDKLRRVVSKFPADPNGPLFDWNTDQDIIITEYIRPRPYHTYLDVQGPGVVGWPEWTYDSTAVRDRPPTSINIIVNLQSVFYKTAAGECAIFAPGHSASGVVPIHTGTYTDYLVPLRFTPNGVFQVIGVDGLPVQVPFTRTEYYAQGRVTLAPQVYTFEYIHDPKAIYPSGLPNGVAYSSDPVYGGTNCLELIKKVKITETLLVSLEMGGWPGETINNSGNYEGRYGTTGYVSYSRNFRYQVERTTRGRLVEYPNGSNEMFCDPASAYWVPDEPVSGFGLGDQAYGQGTIDTPYRTNKVALAGCSPPKPAPPPLSAPYVVDSVPVANLFTTPMGGGREGGLDQKLTKAETEAIVSDYYSLPENLSGTELLIDRLVPYIYDVPLKAGRLRNPLGSIGESTWYGLTWTTTEYSADAFYALDGDGIDHLYGVVITGENGIYTLHVSLDKTPVGSWPVLDFFPGNDGTLRFLDGTLWPANKLGVKPHYNFMHPDWPFRDTARLSPFTTRLRDPKQDKLGKQFTAAAADAPITLWLESYDPDA